VEKIGPSVEFEEAAAAVAVVEEEDDAEAAGRGGVGVKSARMGPDGTARLWGSAMADVVIAVDGGGSGAGERVWNEKVVVVAVDDEALALFAGEGLGVTRWDVAMPAVLAVVELPAPKIASPNELNSAVSEREEEAAAATGACILITDDRRSMLLLLLLDSSTIAE
jgi:hypothetical protein